MHTLKNKKETKQNDDPLGALQQQWQMKEREREKKNQNQVMFDIMQKIRRGTADKTEH